MPYLPLGWLSTPVPFGRPGGLFYPSPGCGAGASYSPPVDGRDIATRALPARTHPAGPGLAPVSVEADPTVMQRLLTLYEKIGRAP